MDELVEKDTMTSLEIAEVTGKKHAHVMRDIRGLLEQGVNQSKIGLVTYMDKKGRLFLYEILKKHGVLPLVGRKDD